MMLTCVAPSTCTVIIQKVNYDRPPPSSGCTGLSARATERESRIRPKFTRLAREVGSGN